MSSRFLYAEAIIANCIVGDEAVWWRTLGRDPTPAARMLWLQTHPLGANKFADVAADLGPSNDVSPANR
jgi:hypothetical protein